MKKAIFLLINLIFILSLFGTSVFAEEVADSTVSDTDSSVLDETEQEPEVVHAAPLAVIDQGPQKSLARGDLVLLEGDQDTEHRHVAEHDKPDRRRKRKKEKLNVVERQLTLLLGFRCNLVCLAHCPASFKSCKKSVPNQLFMSVWYTFHLHMLYN